MVKVSSAMIDRLFYDPVNHVRIMSDPVSRLMTGKDPEILGKGFICICMRFVKGLVNLQKYF